MFLPTNPTMIFSFLTLASLLPSVIAQSSSSFDISAQCQSSLVSIASSTEGKCLNSAGIAPIFFAGSNTSLIGPFQSWLTGLCSEDPCTNQTLATLVANITQGCSSDLSSLGINNSNVSSITASVQEYYPVVRQIACLKDNNANQLCLVEELYDVQNVTGTLSADNIFSLFPKLITEGLPALGLPQNVTCSNCTKEVYNIIITESPQAITSDENSTLSKQCGADFLDGKTPASISQTAAGSDLSNTNGDSNIALRPLRLRDAPASLIGVAVFLAALL
ncbi:hypothetical protein EDB89DRAFT_1941534 [Lactarius sanguifluus]|nr:hypothetical protein EDB89DRAFT_1941534 [Lactarius sanguifluus]